MTHGCVLIKDIHIRGKLFKCIKSFVHWSLDIETTLAFSSSYRELQVQSRGSCRGPTSSTPGHTSSLKDFKMKRIVVTEIDRWKIAQFSFFLRLEFPVLVFFILSRVEGGDLVKGVTHSRVLVVILSFRATEIFPSSFDVIGGVVKILLQQWWWESLTILGLRMCHNGHQDLSLGP